MATKSKSSTASALQAELAAIQAKIAALQGESMAVSAEAVQRFTREHWRTLRFALVVGGEEKPELAKGKKGYALVKGAQPKWYMALRGFENTMRYQQENGLPVGLHTEPNDKGRTQVQYAQEILSEMVDAGFISPDSALLTGTRKPGRPRKAAKA